jgi:hypothetical protein
VNLQQIKAQAEAEANPEVKFGMERVIRFIETNGSSTGSGEWVSPEEAMRHFDISYSTLLRWKKNGKIKTKQPGGNYGSFRVWIEN